MDWAEIYRRFQQDRNDSPAWEALERRVRRWAAAKLWHRGWHVVDDAVADTCSTVVLTLDRARGADTFAGFALGHFLNVMKPLIKDPPPLPPPPQPPPPTPTIFETLKECLKKLPTRERYAVEVKYFGDATGAEIARALQVTEGNARRILFNGIAHLRECLDPQGKRLVEGNSAAPL